MNNKYEVPEGVDEIVMGGKTIWKRTNSEAEDYNNHLFRILDDNLIAIEDSKRQSGRTTRALRKLLRNGGYLFLHRLNCYDKNVFIPNKSMIISGDTLDMLVHKTQHMSPGSLTVDPTAIWAIYRRELKSIHDKIQTVLKAKG